MQRIEVTREEVEAAFAAACGKGSQLIKAGEIKLMMRALGFEPRNSDVGNMLERLEEMKTKNPSKHGSELIDIDEFMALVQGPNKADKHAEEMRGAFKLFDKAGKGYITAVDLRRVSQELGETLEVDELNEMIEEATKDKDGKVSEEDFFAIMKRTCLY